MLRLCFSILVIAFGIEFIAGLDLDNERPSTQRVRHVRNSTESPAYTRNGQCNLDQFEYRLTKLEVQVAEKSENLRSELREGNRRLQSLEWQSAEAQTALESLRTEMGRFTQTSQQGTVVSPVNPQLDKLDGRIAHLVNGIQLVVATLRGINSDMAVLRNNVSDITNSTHHLLRENDNLVTKEFLSDSLMEVKHHQVYNSFSPSVNKARSRPDLPKSCKEVQARGNNISGIYRIQPELAPKAFMVLCEMTARGGGWTFIQNRFEGAQDFYLNWHNYKVGFGNLAGEFWLGLEHLYELTGEALNELLIELEDADGQRAYAHYSAFSVGDELEGYRLKVLGGYQGDAGDSLGYHAGSQFSTKDMDQDSWAEGSCAQAHYGAWWYRGCEKSNLNGKYLHGPLPEDDTYRGMYWNDFRGPQYGLLKARMMVRARDEGSGSALLDTTLGSSGN